MKETNQAAKRAQKARRAVRKNRILVTSTWGIMLAAFSGFFVLWNHLGTGTTQAAVTKSASETTSDSETRTFTRHHRHSDSSSSAGGQGSNTPFSASGGSDFVGGSAAVSPASGSDFSSGAS